MSGRRSFSSFSRGVPIAHNRPLERASWCCWTLCIWLRNPFFASRRGAPAVYLAVGAQPLVTVYGAEGLGEQVEDVRGLGLVQAVHHPGEHAGRFGADPLGVLLAELLPLLVSDGRVDKR